MNSHTDENAKENPEAGQGIEWGEVIYSYSRADAIADGVLVDVSEVAATLGIRIPVALTEAVWRSYVEFRPEDGAELSEETRLRDLLTVYHSTVARNRPRGDTLLFGFHVAKADRGDWQPHEQPPAAQTGLSRRAHRFVQLKAIVGPGDTAAPVLTILLPFED